MLINMTFLVTFVERGSLPSNLIYIYEKWECERERRTRDLQHDAVMIGKAFYIYHAFLPSFYWKMLVLRRIHWMIVRLLKFKRGYPRPNHVIMIDLIWYTTQHDWPNYIKSKVQPIPITRKPLYSLSSDHHFYFHS